MPIPKKWSRMNRSQIKQTAPTSSGVYELTSFGKQRALYIGQTDNLQRRLLEHLDDKKPNRFRFKEAGFLQSPKSMEKNEFDNYENKHGNTPPWNTQDPRTGWF
ncbi:GIY-YIG nuclease family protein [Haloferax namakaokahaiae]|uniref:GIY-YIG nuclease family protein n=1 Tax=Haloferax namakaokahaiae TaxID=1748331 RepID=A0ABD5ZJ56_9EURY